LLLQKLVNCGQKSFITLGPERDKIPSWLKIKQNTFSKYL